MKNWKRLSFLTAFYTLVPFSTTSHAMPTIWRLPVAQGLATTSSLTAIDHNPGALIQGNRFGIQSGILADSIAFDQVGGLASITWTGRGAGVAFRLENFDGTLRAGTGLAVASRQWGFGFSVRTPFTTISSATLSALVGIRFQPMQDASFGLTVSPLSRQAGFGFSLDLLPRIVILGVDFVGRPVDDYAVLKTGLGLRLGPIQIAGGYGISFFSGGPSANPYDTVKTGWSASLNFGTRKLQLEAHYRILEGLFAGFHFMI